MTLVCRARVLPALLLAFVLVLIGAVPAWAEGSHSEAEHAESGHEHHEPSFDDFNWFYGVLAEVDGVEPSLLFRPKGMPPPFLAMLLNTGLLFFLLARFAVPKMNAALGERKAEIMRGIDDAARMQRDARRSLKKYKRRLRKIDEEVERARKQVLEAGEAERERVVAEAHETKERMERESRILVEQEVKAARELLLRETVRSAIRSAEESIRRHLQPADHERLAEQYLDSIRQSAPLLRGPS